MNWGAVSIPNHIFSGEGEQTLDNGQPIRFQLGKRDGKRTSLFLRYRDRDPDRGYIRVYPGNLRLVSLLLVLIYYVYQYFPDNY